MLIYKITNKINGKVYIGQTINSLKERWRQHCKKSNTCFALRNAIQKYGKENFTVEQLDVACSRDELDKKEQYWIKFYDSMNKNKGYNLTSGGYTNHFVSEETREKLRQNALKMTSTPEFKERIRKIFLNNKFYLGHKSSEKTRKLISEKASKRQIGSGNPFYGKKHTDESKRKMSLTKKGMFAMGKNPAAKKVICVETGEIFSCSREASIKYGMHPNTLSKMIRNNEKAKGLTWRWYNE